MASSFTHFQTHIKLFTITTVFILSSPFTSAAATRTHTRPFKKIYAFGDSFTDTGNTKSANGPISFGHVSNSPYGSTYFHHSTNRYSDGRLVIDFVAQALSLPFLPPYLHINSGDATYGVNFAVAGSTAINHSFFVKNNLTLNITPQSIQTQLIWFNKFMERQGCKGVVAEPKCKFDDALFWVGEIGDNDYAYTVGSSVSSDTVRKLAISSVTKFLQGLFKKGAKYVVVQGLPTSGCLTLSMTLAPESDRDDIGCVKSVNNQSYTHNVALQDTLQDLRRQFPHAVITYLDYWNAYRTVMMNPARYGFKELFDACCGSGDPPYNFNVLATCGTSSATACRNPSQYINWDGVHLTEAMYRVVADMFLNGTFSHPPFKNLMDRTPPGA
ncbi:Lipase_GDSL domain-containing protein [Cephalotus follicularis]|uniref:Lipase_GDSL domain-containing protein n=1 Tax=Cephalotus follicularis TaxID=3775 RepID=A0A1Q3CLA6_CEPFO|nr:Lipase_GDSL domain-containing protein [Cephalotus follicularis]